MTPVTDDEVKDFPTSDSGMKAAGLNRAARMAMRSQLRRGASKKTALDAAKRAIGKR